MAKEIPEDSKNIYRTKLASPLDTLPSISWKDLPLGTNFHIPSIPVLLHFNGENSYLHDWWPRMWYHSHARTLLRLHMHSSSGPNAAQAAEMGGQSWWNLRGGKRGAWTDRGEWMGWEEICGGFEEVFGDGKGSWTEGEGNRKVYNSWGRPVSGGDE